MPQIIAIISYVVLAGIALWAVSMLWKLLRSERAYQAKQKRRATVGRHPVLRQGSVTRSPGEIAAQLENHRARAKYRRGR